jgi:sulfatase maturation enzyme AslB (radical SAM superfamily)
MLAEMGDHRFRLGHVATSTHAELVTSDALLGPLRETLLDGVPQCADCAFAPYCGADPVRHWATQGDVVGHKAFSQFCARQAGMLRHLLSLLEDDAVARNVLLGWV